MKKRSHSRTETGGVFCLEALGNLWPVAGGFQAEKRKFLHGRDFLFYIPPMGLNLGAKCIHQLILMFCSEQRQQNSGFVFLDNFIRFCLSPLHDHKHNGNTISVDVVYRR